MIGFDQAPRNIGWAVGEDSNPLRPEFGCYKPGQYGDADEYLFTDVKTFAAEKIRTSGASAAFYEQVVIQPAHINLPVTESQFVVVGALIAAAAEAQIPIYKVLIGQWRKRFLGRGNAPKGEPDNTKWLKDAARVVCARNNWLTTDHNIAEALGIWEYGLAFASPEYRQRSKAEKLRLDLAQRRLDMQK